LAVEAIRGERTLSQLVLLEMGKCSVWPGFLPFPLIVDPVMFSKNGAELMDARARRAFAKKLLPLAYLLTPNLAEASELAGFEVKDQAAMLRAAEHLVSLGAANVLVTGGHLEGEPVDVLFTRGRQSTIFRGGPRIESAHTHGTGCTFSAAIAAGLAQGLGITEAIANAQHFVRAAILTAPGLGSGCGPLNHFAK
jgi:hydroxymethylpyrimidine/phosphomethylpyrimidine kinase